MKRVLINLCIYSVMAALMIADEFYGVTYAGNIAIFTAWFFIIILLLGLFADPEEMYKDKPSKIVMVGQIAMIMLMVAIGWVFTGACYLAVTFMHYAKRKAYIDEHNKLAA